MTSFLKSLPRRVAAAAVLAFFLLALLLQAEMNFLFSKSRLKIAAYLSGISGYTVKLDKISYGYLSGLHIKGLSIFYDGQNEACVFFKNAAVSINPLPLLWKKIVISRIKIDDAVLLSRKEKEGINLQVIYSDIYKRISGGAGPQPFLLNTAELSISVARSKLRFAGRQEDFLLFKNVNLRFYKSGKVKLKSDVRFVHRMLPGDYALRFFNHNEASQDFKLTLQATSNNRDLSLDMVLLNLQDDQILATGIIRDSIERNPGLDVIFLPSIISLRHLASLKEGLEPKGNLIISLKLTGKMDSVRAFISARIDAADFRCGEMLDIKNMNAGLKYHNGSLRMENVNMVLNNIPLNAELEADIREEPTLRLKLSVSKDFFSSQLLPIERFEVVFNGVIKRALSGELAITTLYRRRGAGLEMQAFFDNIEFDYRNPREKYFKAKKIRLVKKDAGSLQQLNLSDFISRVLLLPAKNQIRAIGVNCRAYNSTLRAAVNLGLKGRPRLVIILNGRNLDAKMLMEDMRIASKLLSGRLDIQLAFDNHRKEFLKGVCYIRDGSVDLNALEGAVKLPPLGEVTFDILRLYLAVLKDSIKISGLKLSSGNILLNGQWQISSALNGVLDVQIESELLRESPQFKRLLELAGIEKRYVGFRFVLGGIPKAIRLMWLKNEFKEKIDSILPARIKKSIEADLDKMVEDLSAGPPGQMPAVP